MLPILAALILSASDTQPEAWVVVTKRSGVSKPAALEMAKAISQTLWNKGVPNTTEPADLSSCNAKLVCLVEAALKKKVSVLVTVETANVLDEVVVHTEALSIDGDGKKLAAFDFEGVAKNLGTEAATKVDATFVPAVRTALGIPLVPVAVAEKPAPVVEPAPAPSPEPVVAVAAKKEAPSSGTSGVKIAGIAVAAAGVVSLGVAIGMGVKTLGAVNQQKSLCPAGQPCTNPAAYDSFNDARSSQSLAVVFGVIGGVLVAGGATLLLVDMGSGTQVSLAPAVSPGSAGVLISGRF